MSRLGLGAGFDLLTAEAPVDAAAAAITGHRVHMENYGALAVCMVKGIGGAAEAPTITLQEHDAATAGTSQNLAVIDEYWKKEELALDGDETWTRVAQTAAATVTDATWDDAFEVAVVFEVRAEQLSDGFEWVSANIADVGVTAQLISLFYIGYDLKVQRAPQNLPQPNA